MKENPYIEKIECSESEVTFSNRVAVGFAILFLGGLILIPCARHLVSLSEPKEDRWLPVVEFWRKENQKTFNHFFNKKSKNDTIEREMPNLRDHLQAFEAGVKESNFRKRIQQSEQHWLTSIYQTGNRKVIIGKQGWLYYRPAVDSLTGRGPLTPEPDSVTKDPDRPIWNEVLPVITQFAQQLSERGAELMIVPIPVKPMVQAEGFSTAEIFTHPDQGRFYQALRSRGIQVVDLVPAFQKAKTKGKSLFLKQDTHWRSDIAKLAAIEVGSQVKQKQWFSEVEIYPVANLQKVERSALGDLVGMLGLPPGQKRFSPEKLSIERVLESHTGKALEGDLLSPVSILGDSFINIYEEPGLGFGDEKNDQGLIGAGFSSHLANMLGIRPHVIAVNGEGATGVRKAFAALPDNVVRSRKLVIWAIASRDFFLAESAANRAGVYWRDVEFNPNEEIIEPPIPVTNDDPQSEYTVLTGVLKEKSAIEDPNKTSYTEAIYSALFEDVEVEKGEYYDPEAYVFMWAFKDRELLSTAKLMVGRRYRLKLMPLYNRPVISKKTQLDDITVFDLERFFAEEVIAVEQ